MKNDTISLWGEKRYHSLDYYLKNTYHEKVYRIALNAGLSCPNRDGRLDTRGCIFCSAGGSGDFAASPTLSITEQLETEKRILRAKRNCNKFIAYFQSYTNTYAPVAYLCSIYEEALQSPEIVALSIGTRSDCLGEDVLLLLSELQEKYPHKQIWIELGLQTMHNDTLQKMNTHTTVEQFDSAIDALTRIHIPVIAHVILGFPNETKEMMLQTISHVSRLPVSGIKLQLLHVLKNTELGNRYLEKPFPVMELMPYCDLVIDCLELLPPDLVVHRLTGDGPRNLLLAPLWSTDKKRVLNTIHHRLKERDTWQGRLFIS